MSRKRRVYIIRQTHDPVEDNVYSSLSKVADKLEDDLSYSALAGRLHRAKDRTGKSLIRLKDKDGNPITVEIKEVE